MAVRETFHRRLCEKKFRTKDVAFGQLNERFIREYHDFVVLELGYGHQTLRHYLAILKKICKIAFKEGHSDRQHFAHYKLPKQTPSFVMVSQRLRLAKGNYIQGDTLCASFDLRFRVTFPDEGNSQEHTFRGTICEVIRPKDFDPFAAKNFMMFDLPTALREISDEGRERLTVWYAERDGRLMPVEYMEWNDGTQFLGRTPSFHRWGVFTG